MHPIARAGLALVFSVVAVQPLLSQDREVRSAVFVHASPAATGADTVEVPPADLMFLKSTWWALLFGVTGALAGNLIDNIYCEGEHGDEEGFIFGPCHFYSATATPVGWFGGASIGAARASLRAARQRGCSSPLAVVRAMGGALIGVAPGAIVIAARSEHPSRGFFIGAAPALAAAGATLALHDCRA